MRQEDPYAKLAGLMTKCAKSGATPGIAIGKITAPPPDIHVSYNGMDLDRKDVWISCYLLSGYTRHVVGATSYAGGGSGDAAYESHNHPVDNDETWTDTLKPGDYVAIMPFIKADTQDNRPQQYIILDKIEHL